MKPHPRIRKTVKWGGAAVTVLLVMVWMGSGWWAVNWSSRNLSVIGLSGGHVDLMVQHLPPIKPSAGWQVIRRNPATLLQRFDFGSRFIRFPGGAGWTAIVPLWWAIPVPLAACVVAWRLDTLARRRARLNLCAKCGYDRTGLVGGAEGAMCPECGAAPASSSSTTP